MYLLWIDVFHWSTAWTLVVSSAHIIYISRFETSLWGEPNLSTFTRFILGHYIYLYLYIHIQHILHILYIIYMYKTICWMKCSRLTSAQTNRTCIGTHNGIGSTSSLRVCWALHQSCLSFQSIFGINMHTQLPTSFDRTAGMRATMANLWYGWARFGLGSYSRIVYWMFVKKAFKNSLMPALDLSLVAYGCRACERTKPRALTIPGRSQTSITECVRSHGWTRNVPSLDVKRLKRCPFWFWQFIYILTIAWFDWTSCQYKGVYRLLMGRFRLLPFCFDFDTVLPFCV